jgi:hypothetical protein
VANSPVATGGFEARLERVAETIDLLRAQLEDEVEIRDQLVAEAIDAGERRSDIARWARLSRSRLHQVRLARLVELQEVEPDPTP